MVDHPGESQVFLHLGDGGKVLRLPEKFCVDLGNGLMGELKSTFGSDAVPPKPTPAGLFVALSGLLYRLLP